MAFIDKINPDVPEGRLLIRNGDYVLKDPEAEVSSIPLDKKWERLLKYIKDKGYSTKEIDRMISAYSLVYKRRAARNIDQYNEIVKDYPLLINVSKILGHQSVATTMKYIGITPKMTEKAISQIESTSLRGISAKWKGNAKLEDLIR